MKKPITLIASLIMILNIASAQKGNLCFKADMNISTFVGSEAGGSNARFGYSFGMLKDFPINNIISIVPELKYSNLGARTDYNGQTVNLELNYIAVPIMLRGRLNSMISIEIGPQFAYLINAKFVVGELSVDITDAMEKFDAGIGAGMVFDINRFFVTGRYNYSLTQLIKDQNAYNSVFAMGLGFKF